MLKYPAIFLDLGIASCSTSSDKQRSRPVHADSVSVETVSSRNENQIVTFDDGQRDTLYDRPDEIQARDVVAVHFEKKALTACYIGCGSGTSFYVESLFVKLPDKVIRSRISKITTAIEFMTTDNRTHYLMAFENGKNCRLKQNAPVLFECYLFSVQLQSGQNARILIMGDMSEI